MRIARELGNVSLLLPDGVDHLGDAPYTLHSAISHALRILGYQENLPREEMPAKGIWLDGPALEAHFKRIDREKRKKYPGLHNDDDDDDPADAEVNAVELVKRG